MVNNEKRTELTNNIKIKTMKPSILKKAFSFLVAGVICSFSAIANDTNSNFDFTETSKEIKNNIKFASSYTTHSSEKVNVVFTVDESGKVNCVIANTDNKQLKQTIEKQFEHLILKQLKANNAYSIQFNFKTL